MVEQGEVPEKKNLPKGEQERRDLLDKRQLLLRELSELGFFGGYCSACGAKCTIQSMKNMIAGEKVSITGTSDDVEQWKSLLQTYLKSFDFDAADKTVKKILEASPLDAYANELYPKISDWKDYDIKDGILYKYNGKAKRTEVPYGVITIEGGAFADCVVEEVVLPDTVGKLCGDVIGAFRGCKKLGIINLPESVKYVGEAAFEGTSLVKVCIPQSVEVIGAKAFAFCSSLAEITIPESVKHIGVAAFSYCTALSSVRMESLVCRISDSIFAGCTMLTHFEIPASIQEIGALAFSQSGLQEIEIPSGVTFVGG